MSEDKNHWYSLTNSNYFQENYRMLCLGWQSATILKLRKIVHYLANKYLPKVNIKNTRKNFVFGQLSRSPY